MLYFIIDYAQMLKAVPTCGGAATRAAVARGTELKGSPKSWAWPSISLVQIKPEVDQRADKRPQMGDVKDCSTLVDRADCVVMFFREGYYALNRQKTKGACRARPRRTSRTYPSRSGVTRRWGS